MLEEGYLSSDSCDDSAESAREEKGPNLDELCQEFAQLAHQGAVGRNLLSNPSGGGTGNAPGVKDHECEPVSSRKNPRQTQYVRFCSLDQDCPKFASWKVVDSGGSGWTVEPEPEGCDPLPPEVQEKAGTSCFVTSYGQCSKGQEVNLATMGLSPRLMDLMQPPIEVSEWVAGHDGYSSQYELKVALLGHNGVAVQSYFERLRLDPEQSGRWRLVHHTFRDYGRGVRSVLFRHAGKDNEFLQGHYGCKMAAASVVVHMPPCCSTPTTSSNSDVLPLSPED